MSISRPFEKETKSQLQKDFYNLWIKYQIKDFNPDTTTKIKLFKSLTVEQTIKTFFVCVYAGILNTIYRICIDV